MFLVGDAPGLAAAGAGLAAVVGVVSPTPCSDLMYAINCSNWSSLTWPWKVGMIGPKPATSCACGFKIDVRT